MAKTWEVDFLQSRKPIEAEFKGSVVYKLPIASPEELGGVKPVAKTEDMVQPVGVDAEGALWVKESSLRPDWNQNDPNADDYVKNRTHWTEETPFIVVENLSSQDYPSEVYPRHVFTIGFEYDVTWNGVLYERLICQSIGGYNALGNSDGDNLPFYIDDDNGSGLYIRALDGSEDWTLSIVEYVVEVHELDPKYLPEDTATKLEVAYAVEQAMEAGEKAENAIEEALNAQIMAESKISMPSSGELNQMLAVTESVDGVPTKIECVDASKDWEQYDETKVDYIRNRTHYYNVTTYASVINQSGGIELAPVGYIKDGKKYLHENSIFRIIINGVENIISTKLWIGDEGQVVMGSKIFGLNADGWALTVGITLKLHRASRVFMASISFDNQDKEIICSAYYEQRDVKLLDEKYLPNTIARVSDIPSIEGLATEEYVNEALSGFEGNGVSYVARDTAPEDTEVLWVDTSDNTQDGTADQSGGISITGAKVGQTIRIAEVDENGSPTKWEAVSSTSVPEYTSQDNGKFLSIVNDVPTWTTVLNGEEVEF